MKPQTFQHPEIRDENDNIIKPGAFGKNTPFCTKGNDGILDYVANDLEYLYKKSESTDNDNLKAKSLAVTGTSDLNLVNADTVKAKSLAVTGTSDLNLVNADTVKAKSLAVTGTSAAPTAPTGDSSKTIANTEFVQNAVSGLVGAAPETLDTLNELATALGNDPNFATTVSNQIGKKANQTDLEELSTKVDKRFKAMIDILYPIGIVVTTATDDALKPGEADGLAQWEEIAQDRVLQGTSSGAGGTIEAGLPNITGKVWLRPLDNGDGITWDKENGAFITKVIEDPNDSSGAIAKGSGGKPFGSINLDASKSNSIYGNSSTVQPPAYKVHFWKRVS